MDKKQKARVAALEADRKAAGLSYRALGQAAGVSDSRIREAVKDVGNMNDDNWGKTAAAMPGGKLAQLLEKEGIAIPAPLSDRTAPVPAKAGMRHDGEADSDRFTVPFSRLRLAPNYRTTHDAENLEGLAASILDKGIMQNLVVRPADAKGIHEVHAGSRRFRAVELNVKAKRCGADFPVPVLVRALADDEALALSIVENLQREEVHPVEEAEAFRRLRDDHAWPTKKIAEALGGADKLRYVQQRINIAEKLTPAAKEALHEDKIGLDQARALWALPPALQDRTLKRAVAGDDAEKIRRGAAFGLPPMSAAHFDAALYDGEIYDAGKIAYAVDVARFAKLQETAIRDTLAALKKKWGGGIVQTSQYYFDLSGWQKTKDKEKGVALYRLVTENEHGSLPKWQRIEVKEGYIRASAAKKPGAPDGAPAAEEAKPHGAKHLEQAHHLKTLELQRAIAENDKGPAIAMALAVVSLIGFEYGGIVSVKFAADRRGQFARTLAPVFKTLETALRPFVEKGLLRGEGGLREGIHIAAGRHGDFFQALLETPRGHLEKIFTLSIALETGSFISYPLRYGDDLLAVAAAEASGATLAGKWRMTEEYLKPYTRAQLDSVAEACLPDDAETKLPPKKGEAISALMNHVRRREDWLAPELEFGPRSIVEANAAAMLGFPLPDRPEPDFDEEDDDLEDEGDLADDDTQDEEEAA